MGKQIHKVNPNLFTVFSEPGDATRYEYLVYRDGPDEFTFAPTRSTFKYPQRINYWETKGCELVDRSFDEVVLGLADRWGCNPCTVAECIRTLQKIKEQQL